MYNIVKKIKTKLFHKDRQVSNQLDHVFLVPTIFKLVGIDEEPTSGYHLAETLDISFRSQYCINMEELLPDDFCITHYLIV